MLDDKIFFGSRYMWERTRVDVSRLGKGYFCSARHFSVGLGVTLAVLCLLDASVGRCQGQEKTGGIVVRVQLPDQSPIGEGASGNLYNFSGAPVGTTTTDGGAHGFG